MYSFQLTTEMSWSSHLALCDTISRQVKRRLIENLGLVFKIFDYSILREQESDYSCSVFGSSNVSGFESISSTY